VSIQFQQQEEEKEVDEMRREEWEALQRMGMGMQGRDKAETVCC
jgi:tartrate dehydratase alpha subunit/fumarate hydratase class I-like protein